MTTNITTATNTPGGLWLATSRAGELAGLLDGLLEWLCDAEPDALADLEAHLARHATTHGGIFAAEEFTAGTDSIAATFTWLIDAYARSSNSTTTTASEPGRRRRRADPQISAQIAP